VGEQHVVVARAVIRSERARASAVAWRRRGRPSPYTSPPRTATAALTSSPRPPLWKGVRRWGWGGWRGWATRPTPPPTTPTITATPTTRRHSTSTRGPSGASTTHTLTRYWLYRPQFLFVAVPQSKLMQFLVQKYKYDIHISVIYTNMVHILKKTCGTYLPISEVFIIFLWQNAYGIP
jgi:hypothetical protein